MLEYDVPMWCPDGLEDSDLIGVSLQTLSRAVFATRPEELAAVDAPRSDGEDQG